MLFCLKLPPLFVQIHEKERFLRRLGIFFGLVLLLSVLSVLPGYAVADPTNGGWDAAWSPDSTTVAFTSGSPHGVPNLWIAKAHKPVPRKMTARGAHNPKWLPDGKTVVFGTIRRGNPIFMAIDANGEPGSEKQIEALPAGAESPVWSPDGSLIAYALPSKDGISRDLSFARMSGGGTTGLTTKLWCREWVWTPDGSKIAFTVGKSTGTSIWTVDTASKELRLIYRGFCSAINYSPDGKLLAIAVPAVESGFKISIIELASGSIKEIPVKTFNGQKLTWSNDGSHLFFVSSRKSEPAVWTVGVDGKNLTRLSRKGVPTTAPVLSPDGKRMTCEASSKRSYSPELIVCNISGRLLGALSNRGTPSFWSPVWSPKGDELAFQSDVSHMGELFIGTTVGGMSKALTPIFGGDPADVSWFADGQKLLMADSGRLLVVDRAGGKDAAKPIPNLATQVQTPRLIGDEVIFTEWGMRDAAISAMKLDGSAKRLLTQKPEDLPKPEDESEPGAQNTSDSATGNPHAELGLVGPEENLDKNAKPPVVDTWPAVSSDGKMVAFVRDGQVWLVNADGTGARQITQFKAAQGTTISVAAPCWSPRDNSIVFLAFNRESNKMALEIWICGTEAGSERLVCTEDVDTEFGAYYLACTSTPIFVQDGARILFTSLAGGEPHAVTIGLDGAGLREIVPAPSSFPSLDGAGKSLVYVDLSNSRERLRVMDLATGKSTNPLFEK
jgi:Tol biopolymer transport system component